jgi:endonuclease YncB( thermonuclease family)
VEELAPAESLQGVQQAFRGEDGRQVLLRQVSCVAPQKTEGNAMTTRACIICSTQFKPRTSRVVCCSAECTRERRNRWQAAMRARQSKRTCLAGRVRVEGFITDDDKLRRACRRGDALYAQALLREGYGHLTSKFGASADYEKEGEAA